MKKKLSEKISLNKMMNYSEEEILMHLEARGFDLDAKIVRFEDWINNQVIYMQTQY